MVCQRWVAFLTRKDEEQKSVLKKSRNYEKKVYQKERRARHSPWEALREGDDGETKSFKRGYIKVITRHITNFYITDLLSRLCSADSRSCFHLFIS